MQQYSTDTMTALVTAAGAWKRRDDVPVPVPGDGQVLLRAAHAAINNADVAALDNSASAGRADPEQVAGYEVVGTVVGRGPGVGDGLAGRRVMASTTGAFAQFVLADERHCLSVPAGVDDQLAAALPTAMLTEHGALRAGGFAPGQRVLITGASSAIGLVGVQVARSLGADVVVATTRSPSKVDLLRDLGADEVVTDLDSLPATARALTGGAGVDLVLDHVGAPAFSKAVESVRKHGTVVQVGRLGGAASSLDLDALSYGRVTVRGVSFGEADELAELLATAGREVLPYVEAGEVRPVVDTVLDFDDADAAAALVRDGRAVGKVVLRVP